MKSVALTVAEWCSTQFMGIDRSKWHPCTKLAKEGEYYPPRWKWRRTGPNCETGRIDHCMYMKDTAAALVNYNQCSHHKPSGPGWSLCS